MWCPPLNIICLTKRRRAWLGVATSLLWTSLASAADPVDLASAYRLQTRAIQLQLGGKQPLGFKAGLTSQAEQQRFGASGPVAGVLPANAELGAVVRLGDFLQPMLEMELAFRLRQPVDTPVASVSALKDLVAAFTVAVEFPDLGLLTVPGGEASGRAPSVAEIIASNVGAKHLILGNTLRLADQSPDDITLKLLLNGQDLRVVQSSDLSEGQWQTLLFLVNRTVASGWRIEPGQWLLTGALGGMLPLQAGEYRLLTDLGDIRFRVQP